MYDSFPYLWINAEKGRGRTTAGKLIEVLAFNGSFSVGSSEADFFRSIEQFRPTMIIDEVENLGTRGSAEHQWRISIETSGKTHGFDRDCFASLAMTVCMCHCEERSDEAISKPQLFCENSIDRFTT